jgi:hypothetical protein
VHFLKSEKNFSPERRKKEAAIKKCICDISQQHTAQLQAGEEEIRSKNIKGPRKYSLVVFSHTAEKKKISSRKKNDE